MPSMVHAPLITPGFFKEKTGDHLASFTTVNGRTSPPSPLRLTAINGMASNTVHPRPITLPSPERPHESLPREPTQDRWTPPQPAVESAQRSAYENGNQNGNSSSSPSSSGSDRSILSPVKRKRSASIEGDRSLTSPEGAPGQRRRLDSHAPARRSNSPNTIAKVQQLVTDHPQPRTLPPVDRIDTERPWQAPPREMTYSAQSRDAFHDTQIQHRELLRNSDSDSSRVSPLKTQLSAVEALNGSSPSSTTRTTAAGVQVDPKKRKRQFANRTKTGCGTCRRRKKKCDEGKPECAFMII